MRSRIGEFKSGRRRAAGLALAIATACAAISACSQVTAPQTAPEAAPEAGYLRANPADMQWWQEARFGLFIHWGPVSIKGTEIGWSRGGERRGTGGGKGDVPVEVYDNLYKQFNPVKFNAKEWVEMAKAAGMKYLVFTTKHHDGFSMFDSKLTDYKITNSPFKRDVVAELAKACHEGGLRLGFYYSPPDWHHADYRTENHARYVQYLHGQLRELCSNYGQVDVIWFDGLGGTAKDWDSDNLFKMIRQLQPHVLINNRAGLPADFDTPEQQIGKFQIDRPWESCITIGRQWAYKPDDQIKSAAECIQTLVRCAGGDGNLLFNVGPMPTGEIEPPQVERLKEMGRWLKEHGQTIYGTHGGPFIPGRWGASTHKGKRIFLHVMDWNGDAPDLDLPAINKKIVSFSSLTGGRVQVEQQPGGTRVSMPPADRNEIDTVIQLELDGPAGEIKPAALASGSLAVGKKATASNVFQNNPALGAGMAVDDDPTTRWATDAGVTQAWLEVDLGKPETIGRASISEAFDRAREFELQYKQGDEWRTITRGTRIGQERSLAFEPVTAQFVRLNILQGKDGPTIWEFQVFAPANKVRSEK